MNVFVFVVVYCGVILSLKIRMIVGVRMDIVCNLI